jgi:regulator of sigma E protease
MDALLHNAGTVLAVILVFTTIILVHELGHFITAKLAGVRVEQFAVGFGPPLFSLRRGETVYAVRALPLGGFVKLAGMDTSAPGPRDFNGKALWQRLVIIVAGAAVNLTVPILIFAAVLAVGSPVRVEEIIGAPAREAGLMRGDVIKAIDGQPVARHRDMQRAVEASHGEPVTLTLERRHQLIQARLTPYRDGERLLVGVRVTSGIAPRPPLQALADGAVQERDIITGTFVAFGRLLTGAEPGGLTGSHGVVGPVGILNLTAAETQQGLPALAFWMGFLSISLGILNILPFPGLDGGRAAFLLLELVRRRPLDPMREQTVHYIGLAILLAFIVLVTYNDIVRIATRG